MGFTAFNQHQVPTGQRILIVIDPFYRHSVPTGQSRQIEHFNLVLISHHFDTLTCVEQRAKRGEGSQNHADASSTSTSRCVLEAESANKDVGYKKDSSLSVSSALRN